MTDYSQPQVQSQAHNMVVCGIYHDSDWSIDDEVGEWAKRAR